MATVRMQAPADASGEFQCNAIGQSGATYRDVAPGSILEVDARDAPVLLQVGFKYAPSN